jgi:hypothetical protein
MKAMKMGVPAEMTTRVNPATHGQMHVSKGEIMAATYLALS